MDKLDLIRELISKLMIKDEKTSIEKDILETWNELIKQPFDKESAHKQVVSNDSNYPDIFFTIAAMPSTVQLPKSYQPTEADIKYNLQNQLILLAGKEWEAQLNGK